MVDSLKIGNDSLKQINAMLDIEDIERILDETQEGAEKQRVSIAQTNIYKINGVNMCITVILKYKLFSQVMI